MKISCDVILDLIPLVKDGVASLDSTLLVNEHIKDCESCRALFEATDSNDLEVTKEEDEKIIFRIKRSIFITELIILMAGTIIGIALSNSMGIFYNFLIMPVIGAVGFAALKKKWYIVPISVFLVTFIWQSIDGIIHGGAEGFTIYYGLYFSVIYAVLVLLGVIITKLLKFAFSKERC